MPAMRWCWAPGNDGVSTSRRPLVALAAGIDGDPSRRCGAVADP